jgi:hypothetical protein
MRVRLLTSAKSREKGTDETLREIEATGLGRLSSFPSVNFPPPFSFAFLPKDQNPVSAPFYIYIV